MGKVTVVKSGDRQRGFYDWAKFDPPKGLQYQQLEDGYGVFDCWWKSADGRKIAELANFNPRGGFLGLRTLPITTFRIICLSTEWTEEIVAWAKSVSGEIEENIKVIER